MKKSLGLVVTAALVFGPVIPALAQGNVTQNSATAKTQAEVSHVMKQQGSVLKPVCTDQDGAADCVKPKTPSEEKLPAVKHHEKEVTKTASVPPMHKAHAPVHYINYGAIASPPPGGFKTQPSYGGPVVAGCNQLATKHGLRYEARVTFVHECIMNTLTKELNLSQAHMRALAQKEQHKAVKTAEKAA